MAGKKPNRQRRERDNPRDTVAKALRTLQRVLAENAQLLDASQERLSIDIELTDAPFARWRDQASALLKQAAELRGSQANTPRPGSLWCFQCKSDSCGHAKPADPRDAFSGYTATGKPTWEKFIDLCLKFRPPNMDGLFDEKPKFVVMALTDDQMSDERLPEFVGSRHVMRVVGQVVIGLLPASLKLADTTSDKRALTLQLMVAQNAYGQRDYHLHILGFTHNEIAEAAGRLKSQRSPAERLRRLIAKTRSRLAASEQKMATLQGTMAEKHDAFITKILGSLRGEAEQIFTSTQRRTQHAQKRHRDGTRPTRVVWSDAAAVPRERVFRDNRHETFVVVGRRNRAHVFAPDGRHVTSLRLQAGEVDRKLKKQRWVTISKEAYKTLMGRLMVPKQAQADLL